MENIAQIKMGIGNVAYQVFDKDGNAKPIFQENKLFRFLMKKGIVSPLTVKIPFLFGTWKKEKIVKNLVTNAGKAAQAGLCNGVGSVPAFTYIAVGTGINAANVTDTTLQTETVGSGLSRAAATTSLVTTTVANDTAQLLKQFSVLGNVAVTESGVLNAASVGTLLCRQVFSAINVQNGDTLQIIWKVAMS